MARMPGTDADLDRLFQLPLSEFTAERNALAKRAGADGAAIKALQKPPVAAWAVNQLFFKDRDRYEALVAASTEMRRTHKAVLEGKKGDLRTAGREHDVAMDAALKATLTLMKDAGQPVTDATRQAIVSTLRALPADEPPGRLTRTLSPGGFEMLAGISPKPGAKASPPKLTVVPPARGRSDTTGDAKAEREAARERERRAALERAVRDADQRARQAEFEAARASRDVGKAENQVERARQALRDAQAELDQAEQAVTTASRARDTADKRVRDAQAALEKARAALERAT
jgi:hypothetical protein